METAAPGSLSSTLLTPITFGLLISLAALLAWLSTSPARRPRAVNERLSDFVDRDVVADTEMARSLTTRAIWPILRGLLRFLGGFMPKRYMDKTALTLVRAGEPGGLGVLDFMGLRLLLAVVIGSLFIFVSGSSQPIVVTLRNGVLGAVLGLMLPPFWLGRRVRARQNQIQRALPDALDMLTVGVEAGLAFESALLRVGEQWHNALTLEFRRMVAEMRMGTSRGEALQRMADRVDVAELTTFVAVLVQSAQLGISVSHVLHTQADQMRIKRRQRAEELAHQASVKMIIVLVFFIFPVIFFVILGPIIPGVLEFLQNVSG